MKKVTKTGSKALDQALDYSQMSEGAKYDVEQAASMAGVTVDGYLEKLRIGATRPGRGAEALGIPTRRSK
jgi:hypothetical protein